MISNPNLPKVSKLTINKEQPSSHPGSSYPRSSYLRSSHLRSSHPRNNHPRSSHLKSFQPRSNHNAAPKTNNYQKTFIKWLLNELKLENDLIKILSFNKNTNLYIICINWQKFPCCLIRLVPFRYEYIIK